MNSTTKISLTVWLTLAFVLAAHTELNAQGTVQAESVTVVPEKKEVTKTAHKKPDRFSHHLPILAWSMGIPVGDSYDHVADFSLSGIIFEYRYRINPMFSVGGLIGWNTFNEKKTSTESRDNVTVNGTQLRWLESVPLAVSGNYYIPLGSRVEGFVGLNLGAYYINRFTDLAWWRLDESAWHFGVAPDLGVLIPLQNVALVISSKFNYLVKSGDSPQELFFTFNVGLGFSN